MGEAGGQGGKTQAACKEEMTAAEAVGAEEGWGTGRGARSGAGGFHPAGEGAWQGER